VCTVLNSVWLDLPQGILVNRLWSESGVGLLNLGLQGIVYRTGGVSGNRVQLSRWYERTDSLGRRPRCSFKLAIKPAITAVISHRCQTRRDEPLVSDVYLWYTRTPERDI
jgi:hypothetical protein